MQTEMSHRTTYQENAEWQKKQNDELIESLLHFSIDFLNEIEVGNIYYECNYVDDLKNLIEKANKHLNP